MIKNLLSTGLILCFLAGANFLQAQDMTAKISEPKKVEVMTFAGQAPSLVNAEVIIEGMVTHVCKHGGKKMFIMSSDPDVQVKITTGEKMAAFPPELEGSNVVVKGHVEEIIDEYESEETHELDEAHEKIYHKPQYSIAAVSYNVIEK